MSTARLLKAEIERLRALVDLPRSDYALIQPGDSTDGYPASALLIVSHVPKKDYPPGGLV